MRSPFRADQVGSLLRPAALRAARAAFKSGALSAEKLAAAEDDAIAVAVRRQLDIGLQSITDGEMRRDWWHLDFLAGFDGIGMRRSEALAFHAEDEIPPTATVTGRIGLSKPNMVAHFQFLQARLDAAPPACAKFTIPSPSMAHLRMGSKNIPRDVYADSQQYWTDLADAYRVAIDQLYRAGCRYLQLDDVSFSYLCDPKVQQMVRDNGDDPARLHQTYAQAINRALAERPADLLVTMHTCRGNFKSTWVAQTPYVEDVVRSMFTTAVDAYFMEFDSERAGGFDVLRLLPADKQVVLGLITTKHGTLESVDSVKRRIDQASRVVPLQRLALSPQCGFASTHHGNALTEQDQWRKLERVVAIAREVWR